MLRVGMAGLGKMGLSHHAIVNAHPAVKVVAACDQNRYLTEVLSRYSGLNCLDDYDRMLAQCELDAVVIATPSRLHASMVGQALERGLHVFCEKPFVLDAQEGERLADLAESKALVNQVGYHYRFVGAFQEAARVVKSGALGRVHHVRAEAYGPVVLRPKSGTWRASKAEGGGALYDYACHAVDLVHYVVGVPQSVAGVVLNGIHSRDVEDEVYCTLRFEDGASGQLSVNWSDESFRKMSTKITVWGTNGRVCADRQECQIYLRSPHEALPDTAVGWTVRYTTELSPQVWFYLRGEEYSAQIDYFVQSIQTGRKDNINSFRSAVQTDLLVAKILGAAGHEVETSTTLGRTRRRGLWSRLFG